MGFLIIRSSIDSGIAQIIMAQLLQWGPIKGPQSDP